MVAHIDTIDMVVAVATVRVARIPLCLATLVQQQYAVRNPLEFEGYGQHFWGLTASDGPGWTAFPFL